jgi:hypothetical protein
MNCSTSSTVDVGTQTWLGEFELEIGVSLDEYPDCFPEVAREQAVTVLAWARTNQIFSRGICLRGDLVPRAACPRFQVHPVELVDSELKTGGALACIRIRPAKCRAAGEGGAPMK